MMSLSNSLPEEALSNELKDNKPAEVKELPKEDKKEEPKEEPKEEESDAAVGLGSLFG